MEFFLNHSSLKGKVAWVIGAGYGIGFAAATAFAACDATIVFNDPSEEHGKKGLTAYRERRIWEEAGTVGILVNSAGTIERNPMPEMSKDFRKVADVDLNAPLHCAQGRDPRHDRKRLWQDYQYLLHDERAGAEDRLCLRRRPGRLKRRIGMQP